MAEDRAKSPPLGTSTKPNEAETSALKSLQASTEKMAEISDDTQQPESTKGSEKMEKNNEDSKLVDSPNKVEIAKDEKPNETPKPERRSSKDVAEASSAPKSAEDSSENSTKAQSASEDSEKVETLIESKKSDSKSPSSVIRSEDRPEDSAPGSAVEISESVDLEKEKSPEIVAESKEKRPIEAAVSGQEEVSEEVIGGEMAAERKDADDEEEAEVVEDDAEDTEEDCRAEVSEVGIVGPPTAVRDIVNEEELGTTESSSLPDGTNERTLASESRGPDVAEWVEKSRQTNGTSEPIPESMEKSTRRRKKSCTDGTATGALVATRKSQRIITSIIRRSIKCLNKMHAAVEYGSSGVTSGKKVETSEKREEDARGSPKVPQSRQNGAALPEETATAMATSGPAASDRLCPPVKHENLSDAENEQQSMPMDCARPRRQSVDELAAAGSRNSTKSKTANAATVRVPKSERENTRKRRSTDDSLSSSFNPFAKKICFEQRERFIDSLVGTSERVTAEELASRADELRAEVQALDEMARAKEMEWNEILSMRKLKEEAYLRIERRRQVVGFMENGQLTENLPPASLSLTPDWDCSSAVGTSVRAPSTVEDVSPRETKENPESRVLENQESQRLDDSCREPSPAPPKREKTSVSAKSTNNSQRRNASPKQVAENGRKQQQRHQQQQQQQLQQVDPQSLDNRQIGEGRQGPIVDVRSIIADYRLRHPETVPRRYDIDSPARAREVVNANTTSGLINVRRGRRMRNSVNIGLGAGGAMVETTGHNVDSRPSSTDSCKSNTNPAGDNSMSFKDVLVQFAKLSQQQGEPVKTPQNYPDVTLHPVAPSPIIHHSNAQQQTTTTTGSLLHGILTKSQSPRPTTFSPTLARLLTAPERERNTNPAINATPNPQQNTQTQHLLQTYQGSNPVSISDLLSSSKARTEITITPVVNPVVPIHTSHSNNLVHVDDVDEDASLMDDRDSRIASGARDNRDERDSPPRCQGCQERAAQFVCAGCGNQWYCSRDCQVAAWDEHSEVCSG